jgi:hypothetical protein
MVKTSSPGVWKRREGGREGEHTARVIVVEWKEAISLKLGK